MSKALSTVYGMVLSDVVVNCIRLSKSQKESTYNEIQVSSLYNQVDDSVI